MPKLSWQTIPGELLDEALACLDDPTDTLQAVSVCENWRRIAYPRIYASISLKSAHNASLLANTLKESKYGPGALVKELGFGDLWTTGNKKQLSTLISQCPKLICLNADIRKITDELYPDLLDLFNQGHLQHIQSIPSFWSYESKALKDLYSCTALAMKGNLTHLQVVEPTATPEFRMSRREQSKKCLEVGHINLLEHLTSFPRLWAIDVDYVVATFLYEQDSVIDLCATQTSKVHFKLSNSDLFKQSRQPEEVPKLPKLPQLELEKIKQLPHIKELLISGNIVTTRDLEYIMHKFTGLNKISVGGGNLHDYTLIDWLASNGVLSKEVYTRFLQFLISIGNFEAESLTTTLEVEELLEGVAKHRQVKTMTLSYCHGVYAEGLQLSLVNKKKELKHPFTEFSDRKDSAWEMVLNPLNDNYMASYKQVVRLFAGDTVEQIYLEQVLREPFAEDDDIGEALSYILDHYTAIKDIALSGVVFGFCNANAIRRLYSLKFSYCTIYPGALIQLSNSLEYVSYMILEEDPIKKTVVDNVYISIKMPNTTFGEIALPDLYYYYDEEPLLIKIHTSATGTAHYIQSYKEMNAFITKHDFESALISIDTDEIIVHIECVDLEKFNTGSVCFHLHSRKVTYYE